MHHHSSSAIRRYSGSSKGSRSAGLGTGLCVPGGGNKSPSWWRKSSIVRGRSLKSCEGPIRLASVNRGNRSLTSVTLPFIPSGLRINSFRGTMAAFLHSSCKSDPEKPSDRAARRLMSSEDDRDVLESIYRTKGWSELAKVWDGNERTRSRIFLRCSQSGSRIANRLGIRRRIAGSISLGRFVAPSTIIRVFSPVRRPSHCLKMNGNGGAQFRIVRKTYDLRHELCLHHSGHFVITFSSLA
jgi:hypothetical protein